MSTENAKLARILASLRERPTKNMSETFEGLYDDMDRFYGRETEVGYGLGKIVFDGEIKLSPVGGALLSLLDTQMVPQEHWFHPNYPQMEIRASGNVISDEQITLALSSLLPPEVAQTVEGWSPADLVGMLLKHGVEIAHGLEEALCVGLLDEVDDLLAALKNDPGSNIWAIHFTAAVFNDDEDGEYADGYALHLSDATAAYRSTQDIRQSCQLLDVALHSGAPRAVEEQLNEMIYEVFRQILDPDLRAEFAQRLLQGSALRRVVPKMKLVETGSGQKNIH